MKTFAQRMRKPQSENLHQSPAVGAPVGNQAMGALIGYDAGGSASDPALEDKMQAKLQKQFSFPNQEAQREPGGVPLPAAIQKEYEEKSGVPLDDVRVHYDSSIPSEFNAKAFTYGNAIYLGVGEQNSLEHEVVHTIQQKLGIVNPTHTENSLPVNTDPKYEVDSKDHQKMKQRKRRANPSLVVQFNRDDGMLSEAERGKIIHQYIQGKYPGALENKRPRTLLLGEENFSFANALIKKGSKKAADLYATSYRPLNYHRLYMHNIRSLRRKLGAGHVKGDVDATNIQDTQGLPAKFDRVYFNYPRAIFPRPTKELIDDFVRSARKKLNYGGQLHISVPTKHTYDHLPGRRNQGIKHTIYGAGIKRRIEKMGFLFIKQKGDIRDRYRAYGYTHSINDKGTELERLKGKELVFVKVPYNEARALSKETYRAQFD